MAIVNKITSIAKAASAHPKMAVTTIGFSAAAITGGRRALSPAGSRGEKYSVTSQIALWGSNIANTTGALVRHGANYMRSDPRLGGRSAYGVDWRSAVRGAGAGAGIGAVTGGLLGGGGGAVLGAVVGSVAGGSAAMRLNRSVISQTADTIQALYPTRITRGPGARTTSGSGYRTTTSRRKIKPGHLGADGNLVLAMHKNRHRSVL